MPAPVATSPVTRLALWSIRHRTTVVGAWLLLALVGAVLAGRMSGRLSFTFDLPGQPAFETNATIVHTFGSGGTYPPLIVVAQLPGGTSVDSPGVVTQLGAVEARAAAALPGSRTASLASTGNRAFVSADGRTTFALVYPVPDLTVSNPYATAIPALAVALRGQQVGGADVHLTGAVILATGGQTKGNSVLFETLLAGAGALVILAVVFGSLVALLPLVIAGVAIPSAFGIIYALTYVTTMSTLVQNLVALVGLGVAIDYALLIVTRWREERSRGLANRDAVVQAAATAGTSVVLSGVTVTISLAALALTNVPFLRSVGLAGLLIPLLSVAVSATLLPAVLDALGPRLEWPRRTPAGTVSRLWTGVARTVVRHRVVAAAGSILVLAALIFPVLSMDLGQPSAQATAASAPAEPRAGLALLTGSGIGSGVLRPTEILAPADGPSLPAPGGDIRVAAPTTWSHDGVRVELAWGKAEPSSATGRTSLAQIRTAASHLPGARVGGTAAEDDDFIHALYGRNLVVIVLVIVLATFVLLARSLRSLWLPVKALLLNGLSLAAAFGVVTFIWQQGHGTQLLFGSPATGAVTLWVPLAIFALLFGLSMDYEVFILTRINEEYEAGYGTHEAVVRGIAHTGRLVSSGALILFLAFVALGGVPQTDLKILSTGLAAGVLLDATVIRGVLAPALVALLGRANWWLPRPAARLLRISPMAEVRKSAP